MKTPKPAQQKKVIHQEEIEKVQSTDTQKDIIYKEDNGQKTPITQK